jgi:hypothetical protein
MSASVSRDSAPSHHKVKLWITIFKDSCSCSSSTKRDLAVTRLRMEPLKMAVPKPLSSGLRLNQETKARGEFDTDLPSAEKFNC